jgi:hypothetical protein
MDEMQSRLEEAVLDLASMQVSPAYSALLVRIRERISMRRDQLLDAEKPRAVFKIQEEVRALHWVLDQIRSPVDELLKYRSDNPLLAGESVLEVGWDEGAWEALVTEIA